MAAQCSWQRFNFLFATSVQYVLRHYLQIFHESGTRHGHPIANKDDGTPEVKMVMKYVTAIKTAPVGMHLAQIQLPICYISIFSVILSLTTRIDHEHCLPPTKYRMVEGGLSTAHMKARSSSNPNPRGSQMSGIRLLAGSSGHRSLRRFLRRHCPM